MSRTVTRLYDDYDSALAAARDLEANGIPTSDISLIANNAGEGRLVEPVHVDAEGETPGSHAGKDAGVGAVVGGGVGLLTGLGLLTIPGIGPVVGLGWLAATAVGAVAGAAVGGAAGGIVGSLTAEGVAEDDAHVYAEGVRRGGTLVSVHTSEATAPEVEAMLDSHPAVDIAARRTAFRKQGWTRFDPDAEPYEPIQRIRVDPRTGTRG